jgi:hypothetical protein
VEARVECTKNSKSDSSEGNKAAIPDNILTTLGANPQHVTVHDFIPPLLNSQHKNPSAEYVTPPPPITIAYFLSTAARILSTTLSFAQAPQPLHIHG